MKAVAVAVALFAGAFASPLVARQGTSGGVDSLGTICSEVENLVNSLTNTVGAITSPNELTSALPTIVSDLTNLNSTLAPLGNILGALNPVAGAVSGAITGAANGATSGSGTTDGGLLCSLDKILKRQTGGGLTGLGDLDNVTNVLTPVVQILSSVLNAVTSLVGLNSVAGTLTGGESDQLTGPLSGILGTVGGLVPVASITSLLGLKI